MMKKILLSAVAALLLAATQVYAGQWIRINQLGYLPRATKVAVYMSNDPVEIASFSIVDAITGRTVF